MKLFFQRDRLITGIALSAAMATLAALAVELATGPSLSLWMGVAALVAALSGVAGVILMLRYLGRQRTAVQQFVEDLRHTQPQQFGGDIEQLLPAVAGGGPMDDILQGLRDYLLGVGHACQQAQRERARAEVRYSRCAAEKEHLSEILKQLSEPVLAIDEFDELVLANASAEELFALNWQSTESRALTSLLHCEQLVSLLTETRGRKTATQKATELEIADGAGKRHWYNATVTTLTTRKEAGDESPRGAVAVLRDISEQKAIQRRNAEFVSSVSHEMKTPLASIKAYVELLVDGEAEDEQTREEFLEVVNSQAERLQRLVENLLNIARIEAGVVEVDKRQYSLNGVLEEAFNVVQPSAEQKPVALVSDLSPMYLGVHIDRDMILQSAINLLSNAVKYTPAGGTVTLRSRAVDDQVTFEVQDTGVGLSREDKEKVFSKFYRVKKDQRMASGTGLGLPLAKHIVEDVHGGQLTVESEEGQGSTFRVWLPRLQTSPTR